MTNEISKRRGQIGVFLSYALTAMAFFLLSSQMAKANGVWGEEYFPNFELQAHTGETLRFYDDVIKGKVVAVNFIFTTCKDVCPMETARMTSVYKLLDDRVGSDVFFYSITIDPDNDTVEVLRDLVHPLAGLGGHRQDRRLFQEAAGTEFPDLLDHHLHPVLLDQILVRDDHEPLADAEQSADVEMLAGLRHDSLVGGHDQENEVDPGHPRHHVMDELFVARNIDDPDGGHAGQIQIGETELDGDAPFLLLFQPIRLDTGKHPDKTGLAVIHMTGGAEDYFTHG